MNTMLIHVITSIEKPRGYSDSKVGETLKIDANRRHGKGKREMKFLSAISVVGSYYGNSLEHVAQFN